MRRKELKSAEEELRVNFGKTDLSNCSFLFDKKVRINGFRPFFTVARLGGEKFQKF